MEVTKSAADFPEEGAAAAVAAAVHQTLAYFRRENEMKYKKLAPTAEEVTAVATALVNAGLANPKATSDLKESDFETVTKPMDIKKLGIFRRVVRQIDIMTTTNSEIRRASEVSLFSGLQSS